MTTAERVVIKAFPWVALGLIAACVVIYFLLRSGSENGDTFRRDRNLAQTREARLQADKRALIDSARADSIARVKTDSLYRLLVASSTCERNALKRRERLSRPDTLIKTLVDTIYASYDTAIMRAHDKMKSDSISFSDEIAKRGLAYFKIDSANTAKHLKLDSAYVKLADLSDKVGSQKKVITFLGGVSAVLSVILVLIAVL